jgi:hypothetical protein
LGGFWRGWRRNGGWFAGTRLGRDKAGGEALREDFDRFRFRQQAGPAGEQGVDAGAQPRPVGLRQVKMAAEVEESDLTDLIAGAFGDDETEREI